MEMSDNEHDAPPLKVRVVMAVDYELPADEAEREALYGTKDPGQCVLVDLETDPAAFLLDAGFELVSTEVLGAHNDDLATS